MKAAALGLLATPLDLLLRPLERRLYRTAGPPRRPLVFVCGPPRSGTTVVAQTLIRELPFGYLNNLSAVFPRSPLMADRLFGHPRATIGPSPASYYGRTVGWGGPNDGLHIWDRWLGADRTREPTALGPREREEMRRFFGALERLHDRPVLNKNNGLDACAHLVGEVFEQATFVCLARDPVYLAQSLLKARLDIHGRDDVPYGAVEGPAAADPIEDVCRQVLRHERFAAEQQRRLGASRFWIVSYERFCAEPGELVDAVSRRVFGRPTPEGAGPAPLAPSRRSILPPDRLDRIAATLDRLRAATPAAAGA